MSSEVLTLTGGALLGVDPHPNLRARMMANPGPRTVRTGRRRPKARRMALGLEGYVSAEVMAKVPEEHDWSASAADVVAQMYGNDKWGDCVIADRFHVCGMMAAADGSPIPLGTETEAYSAYQAICGPGDNGCVITDVLDYMRDHGIVVGGVTYKIDGYVRVNWRNWDLVRAAIYLFGNLTIGVNLPAAWTSQALWDVTNTQIVGGHDVPAVGFKKDMIRVLSWARKYDVTKAAWVSTRFLEEGYVVLAPQWYNSDRLSPLGFPVDKLAADLKAISGGTIPSIDPPGPVVPPAPKPVPAALPTQFGISYGVTTPYARDATGRIVASGTFSIAVTGVAHGPQPAGGGGEEPFVPPEHWRAPLPSGAEFRSEAADRGTGPYPINPPQVPASADDTDKKLDEAAGDKPGYGLPSHDEQA
jgi:hypothetical protein